MKQSIILTLIFLFGATTAMAGGHGYRSERYTYPDGDRVARYYDVKGNQLDAYYDRLALEAALDGNIGLALALDRKGDALNDRLDAKGERLDEMLDRKRHRIEKRVARRDDHAEAYRYWKHSAY